MASVISRVAVELDSTPAERGLRRLGVQAGKTQQKFAGLQKAAAQIATAFAGIQAAKFVFVKTAELEKQTKSLEVLTGSLTKASGIIKELQQFGAVTPFTSTELVETAKRLKAFGFETENLVDVTKRLGDIAGATGADLGGIATAFGQIQAKGRLQGEELLQLQERGVSLQDELRKMYGLTAEEFRKALEGGRISAEAVNRALKNITDTGGKYAGGAIAQSETLSGKLSTLVDKVETLARAFGQILAPAIKKVFDFAIQAFGAINDLVEVQLLSGQLGLQIDPKTQRALEETAEQIAVLRTGETGLIKSMKFSEEYNRVLRQLEKSELKRQGFEMGILKVPAAFKDAADNNELPALLNQTGAGGAGAAKETPLQAQLKASKELSQSLKNQTILASALTDQERDSLQLRIDKLAIDQEFPALSEKQRQTLKEQLETLFGQKNVTASLIEQADARKKKEEEIAAAQEAAAQKLQQIYDQIGSTIASGVVDTLSAAVDQTKSLADAAANTLRNVASILLQLGVNTALQGTGLGIFKNLSGFANGGRPPVGKPSIVGERGPELFVPNTSGTIVPNNKLGGGGATNVVVNVDAKGSSASGDSGAGKQLGGLIGAAVQAELIKQQRPGGLLSR